MRVLMAAAVAMLVAVPLAAQTAPAQRPDPGPLQHGFAHVNFGAQSQSQDFAESGGFPAYGEEGSFQAAHSIDGGQFFDIGGGVRVWEDLSLGLTFARRAKQTDAAQLTAGVPHLLFTDVLRNASGEAPGIEHNEQAVHLQAHWRIPVTEEFDVALFGGPSFFSVKQDTIDAIQFSEAGGDFSTVNLTGTTVTRRSESATGVHVGLDASYMFTRYIGGGLLLRFSRASVDLPVANGTAKIDAGGFDVAAGARLRF
jgi:hypothetical protein